MLLVEEKIKDSGVIVIKNINYSTESREKAVQKFYDYKKLGIISEGNYDDDKWIFYNDREHKNFEIKLNEFEYEKQRKERKLCNFCDFKDMIKMFVIYKIDSLIILSLSHMKRAIEKFLEVTNFLNIKNLEVIKFEENGYSFPSDFFNEITEFISFIDFDTSEQYRDAIRYIVDIKLDDSNIKYSSRELGRIETIFKFGDIMDNFWNWAEYEKKEKYYPLYLWWRITTIIPLRVTEFTLIPFNCIRKSEEKYYLTLRRSNIKGNSNRTKKNHKVDLDFILQEIEINYSLYSIIDDYKKMVDEYDYDENICKKYRFESGERRFLLSRKSYNLYLEYRGYNKNNYNDDYLGHHCLYYLLAKFYNEIIIEEYKQRVVGKQEDNVELQEDQIEFISLMDTRHHALINLVLNEIEPIIIKKIANHKSVDMSYHYYNHLDKFIRCHTYSTAKRLAYSESREKEIFLTRKLNKSSDIIFRKIFNIDNTELRDVNNGYGKCESKNENFNDCIKVNGQCEKCMYFIPVTTNAKDNIVKLINENEKNMKLEIEEIKELLKIYNKSKIYREEYARKINKIKGLANQNTELLSRYVIKE